LHARIICVADAYDAMTSPRPFRHALTHEEAVAELQQGAGARFDPEIVAAFCSFETIGRIRRYISEGSSLESERVFGDAADIPPQTLLEIIETDPVLALELLRMANALHTDAPTARLMTAGARIGESRLRALVENHGLPASDQESEWRTHSLRCAVAAHQLAERTGVMHPEDAYTLGLLHNAGDLLLHSVFPVEMFELMEMEEHNRLARQVDLFGVEAAQISQWMLEACGVPRPLTAAVQTHHDVMRINAPTALLLHVANRIADAEETYQVAAVDALGTDRLAMLGVSRADLHSICERTAALAEERIMTSQQVAVG
jgi:HD-like signal output (HDOD) protein